jgi:integrase
MLQLSGFPSHGTAGHLTSIKKHFARMTKAAEITNARPYDLRKAFASRLMASGADIKTVIRLTGHTQANVLLRHYAQVVPNKQGEALERALSGWGLEAALEP